ncbi:unnamed protein product [Rotaria magnacalcarata]|uniref:Wbp11/ELF5/Saf1 N-terminal domain-containing protein n=2 Tax=Rotaria magnacalcarata TaxID=392030 RepID=A0A815FCU9_9BILA|nr:unnamed protein product [Rotaria magnacalcarata]CAF4790269.1 unnamed protein product [Rotaria magnacalcarata]
MGGRNISTTKSGKFMNPTDQARKEARKKELKKNKKQRLLVRQNVLKGKNPKSLVSEMEHLDRMEYDPVNPAPYNIKVLQEKRKKVKETWDRVYRLYSKDQPESMTQMDSLLAEYERGRAQLITWFESVKETQRVTLDEIPMPELPSGSIITATTEISTVPTGFHDTPPRSILKQKDSNEPTQRILIARKPPGPPPGRPPILSDNEDISDDEEETPTATKPPQSNERRRIRFADPSSSAPTTGSVSRWSDNIPNEEAEFGTPVAASEPPQYNTERPLIVPPPFPPPPRGMRLPPPPPPAAFFAANPGVRMPPNIRSSFPPQSKSAHQQPPNVFSAPPSLIAKPPQPSSTMNPPPPLSKPSMTFEAKPQIRARQDVTKFVPTVLKVKRGGTASSIGIKTTDKMGGMQLSSSSSRFEDPLSMKGRMGNTGGMINPHLMMVGPSTDDAYDTFMKEINQLI